MLDTNEFARRLRKQRLQKGLSQTELSNAVGVSLLTVFRWEKGERQPRINDIQRLCEVFECTQSDLLNGPAQDSWELKILMKKEGVIDMTEKKSSAVLNIGDDAMAITLSASYELWEDDTKFEELLEQLRKKRAIGLKTRKEDW